MKFGEALRRQKQREKREAKKFCPKGFDISLADVISELNMNEDQIKLVGELTATRKIAHAFVGNNVFYRKATLERLFGYDE